MTGKLIVAYDDSRVPCREIAAITGNKSFGSTIFKRRSLKDRTAETVHKLGYGIFRPIDRDGRFETEDKAGDMPVFRLFSDFAIRDEAAFSVLLEKSLYAKENYRVVVGKRTAAVIYTSVSGFKTDMAHDAGDGFEKIETNAFTDLSEPASFRQFITSGFDARFFNKLKGDDYVVVKSSDNIGKIRSEYEYYYLLPQDMRRWFVQPFDYKEEGGRASYSMERMHMTDIAIRYVHGAIDETEFTDICERLFTFIRERKTKEVSKEEYDANARSLYVDKLKERMESLKASPSFERLEGLIKSGTGYSGIDEISDRYFSLYDKITGKKSFTNVLTIGHGDLCFSNILYNYDLSIIKLIDVKGAMEEKELYMNPYYDIAKLSHSILGLYDFFNSDLYEIGVGEDLKLELRIDHNRTPYEGIFRKYLDKNGLDLSLVRLYEASLFLSMLPYHTDREKKVLGFVLNAAGILDELDKGI